MRGEERQQRSMLMVMDVEQRIPQEHPLRRIKQVTDRVLKNLSLIFDQMYSSVGRPSVPPERLLKGSLLMALYTIRSERLFCEQLDYNLLFRWFLDLELDEKSFDHSSFTSNRKRLLEHEVAGEFFRGVLEQARALKLLSSEHFTVDGTLIQAWASLKSFKRKGEEPSQRSDDDPGNPTVNFHGERRSNATHKSTTDPQALLARRARVKRPSFATRPMPWRKTVTLCSSTCRWSRPTVAPSGVPRWRWPMSGWQVPVASPWAGTRATTRATSSPRVVNSRSPRT